MLGMFLSVTIPTPAFSIQNEKDLLRLSHLVREEIMVIVIFLVLWFPLGGPKQPYSQLVILMMQSLYCAWHSKQLYTARSHKQQHVDWDICWSDTWEEHKLNCEAEIWIFARMLSNKDRFKCRSKLVLSDHSVREPPERVGARANLLQDHLCARKVALFYPIHTLQGLLRFLMSLPYKQFLTQIPLIWKLITKDLL